MQWFFILYILLILWRIFIIIFMFYFISGKANTKKRTQFIEKYKLTHAMSVQWTNSIIMSLRDVLINFKQKADLYSANYPTRTQWANNTSWKNYSVPSKYNFFSLFFFFFCKPAADYEFNILYQITIKWKINKTKGEKRQLLSQNKI